MVVCSVVAVKRGWRCKWKVKGEKVVCDGCDMIIFLLFMRLFINNTRRKGSELTHVSYTPSLVFITGLSTRKNTKETTFFRNMKHRRGRIPENEDWYLTS